MSAGQTSISFFPWQGTKATVGTWTRGQTSGELGMGHLESPSTINNSASWDSWLDSGTWKFCYISVTNTNLGITTVQFNGASQGTIDCYAASLIYNVYTEITGITVATAGIKTLTIIGASKNASSTAYFVAPHSIALIKTAGAHTTGGTDTPGYVVQIIPFAGSKAHTTFNTRTQDPGELGGGYVLSATAINSAISWDIELDAGTYKYAQTHQTGNAAGIYTIQLAAVDKGTIDAYAAAGAANVYVEVTGIVPTAGVNTFQLLMKTKNASSTQYQAYLGSSSWVRTGA